MGLINASGFREDVPHEAGAWVAFRLLSFSALQEARVAKQRTGMAMMVGFDAEQLQGIQASVSEKAQRDPRNNYDVLSLLRDSIVGWSYSEAVNVDELDNRTAQWALDIIIERNGLDETTEAQKNGSRRSTARSRG